MNQLGYSTDKKIENGAEFLLRSGLLFEINRRFLHPLGMALCAIKETYQDGRVEYSFAPYLFDGRLDEEGITYNQEALEGGELTLLEFMESFGMGKMVERQRKLGYVVQRSGKIISSEHL